MNIKIETPCAEYGHQANKWQMVRLAIAGKDDIDAYVMGGCKSIPSPMYRIYQPTKDDDGNLIPGNESQVTQRQKNYWGRARYLNATGQTQEALDGFVWDIEPQEELPARLQDIDVKEFAQLATSEVLALGRFGGLVDMDSYQSGTMAENAQRMPFFVEYKTEQIIYWRFRNNRLLEVRLVETYEEKKDEYDWEIKKQVRRLFIDDAGFYAVEIHKEGGDIESIEPMAQGQRLTEIPFQFFGADDNSPRMSRVPLYDLASENLGHYRLSADNLDNLHYHGQGMTNIYTDMDYSDFNMKNPHGLDVGAGGRNQLGQQDRVEILQIDATGAIPAEMERVEKRMVMLGAMLVVSQSSNQTLGAKKIEFGAATSTLRRVSGNVSDGIEQMLAWAAMFTGESGEIQYRLNTEFFSDELTPQEMQVLLAAVQGSYFPQEEYWAILRKRGYTDKDNEELKEMIADQGVSGVTPEEAAAQAASDLAAQEDEE